VARSAADSIIVRIRGGLGNQMFMYAAARRLALATQMPLKIDLMSGFRRDQWGRCYMLHHFNIAAPEASASESYMSFGGPLRRKIAVALAEMKPFEDRQYVRQQGHTFDSRLLSLKPKGSLYLEGYWQSELYFKDVEDVIRRDLDIVTPHSDESKRLADQISRTTSVAIHLRRLSPHPRFGESQPHLLDKEYYQTAMQRLISELDSPHFFCFGDHLEWFRSWAAGSYPTTFVVGSAERQQVVDGFWLMTSCKHHIVANSSFSWWSAWLSNYSSKKVIAPDPISRKWQDQSHIPRAWVTI
jgi:hypothetical protein